MRGRASPQGDARRDCAATAERSDGRGGRITVGVGGWDINKVVRPSGPPRPLVRTLPGLFWLDPLTQSSDVSDDDSAVIRGDYTTPFERTEHQSDGFPSRADIARDLLMGELHTDQDAP